jgi:hypothetical protein
MNPIAAYTYNLGMDNMKDTAQLSLSSLAISVGALALLGVSGAAHSDPYGCRPDQCDLGNFYTSWLYPLEGAPEGWGNQHVMGGCYIAGGNCGCGSYVYTNAYRETSPGQWTFMGGWGQDIFQGSPECVWF